MSVQAMRALLSGLSAAAVLVAAGSAMGTVIDFESVAPGTAADGLVIGDATFETSSLPVFLGDPAIVTDNTQFMYLSDHFLIGTASAGNFLAVDFAQPVTGLSFGFAGPIGLPEPLNASVTLYDSNSQSIGVYSFDTDTLTFDMYGSNANVLEGLADLTGVGTPVSRMEVVFTFSLPFSQSYKFDNLSYTPIPVPSVLGIAAIGAPLLLRRRR